MAFNIDVANSPQYGMNSYNWTCSSVIQDITVQIQTKVFSYNYIVKLIPVLFKTIYTKWGTTRSNIWLNSIEEDKKKLMDLIVGFCEIKQNELIIFFSSIYDLIKKNHLPVYPVFSGNYPWFNVMIEKYNTVITKELAIHLIRIHYDEIKLVKDLSNDPKYVDELFNNVYANIYFLKTNHCVINKSSNVEITFLLWLFRVMDLMFHKSNY